jgi:hypothetical protein
VSHTHSFCGTTSWSYLDWALSTASSSRVSSWRVTYTSLPTPGDRRDSSFLDGVLVVHQKASRHLLLLDDKERIRDSRLLRGGGGETFLYGSAVILERGWAAGSVF